MTWANFVSILFMGIFANNVITVTGTGADLAMNRSNTLTNSAILGMFTAAIVILSVTINYIVGIVLSSLEIKNIALFVSVFVIAVLVQMAELVAQKLFPKALSELKYLPTFLTSSCAIVAINIEVYIGFTNYLQAIFSAIFYSVGIVLVLLLIGGIKRSLKFREIPYGCERVVVSLLILFVLALAFTAFIK